MIHVHGTTSVHGTSVILLSLRGSVLHATHTPWYSRLHSCNKQTEQWKTTINILCMDNPHHPKTHTHTHTDTMKGL